MLHALKYIGHIATDGWTRQQQQHIHVHVHRAVIDLNTIAAPEYTAINVGIYVYVTREEESILRVYRVKSLPALINYPWVVSSKPQLNGIALTSHKHTVHTLFAAFVSSHQLHLSLVAFSPISIRGRHSNLCQPSFGRTASAYREN